MLWEAIEGKRSEDLATEALSFVLQSSRYPPLQKLIYRWLFDDELTKSTAERAFEITTQESHVGEGRLDLTIRGVDLTVIVENKFDAEFSQGNQLRRYVDILDRESAERRILILLCPERYRNHYEGEALNQFPSQLGAPRTLAELQHELMMRSGIEFLVRTWDELLDHLRCDCVLVSELIDFVRDRVLAPVTFSAEDLNMILSDRIPKLLSSIYNAVNHVRDRLPNDFTGQRMGQSRELHGFLIDHQGFRFWFGYSFKQWPLIKTPFSLQFNHKWLPFNERISEASLLQHGFAKADNDYVFPVGVGESDPDQVLALVNQVCGKISEVIATAVAPV